MLDSTIEIIENLMENQILRNTGVDFYDQNVIRCTSWESALEIVNNPDRVGVQIEFSNQLANKITSISRAEFNRWNEIANDVRRVVFDDLVPKIELDLKNNNAPIDIMSTLRWDIIHILIESEYSYLISPEIYNQPKYYYLTGHFLCGWNRVKDLYIPVVL